ncbi:unnamed protein product [Moneuplotes crassus]|uniref:Uncharacterized protein n=1 Tax=Euplotes crassus TaxID=5936 RepID=A0AAD1TZ94_EUPCR|nr:unnamed protein product [Moneuplotes crassus]
MDTFYKCKNHALPMKYEPIKMRHTKANSSPLQRTKFNLCKPLQKLKMGLQLNISPQITEKLKKMALKNSKNKVFRRRHIDELSTISVGPVKFNKPMRFISPQPRRNALKNAGQVPKARVFSPSNRKFVFYPQNVKFSRKRRLRVSRIERKLHEQNLEDIESSNACFGMRKNTFLQDFKHSPLFQSRGNDRYNRSFNSCGYEVYDQATEEEDQGSPDLFLESISY